MGLPVMIVKSSYINREQLAWHLVLQTREMGA